MKQSLSYYITLMVVKLTGIKKIFSQDPIDYQKVRKNDVPIPKDSYFKGNKAQSFRVMNSLITPIQLEESSENLVIFIHGGAFISGPVQYHWNASKTIAKHAKHTVWMCDYPKAPEHQIIETAKNIDAIYQHALKQYSPENITILGDSVGGNLVVSLTQRLISENHPLPRKLILISPVMDASLSNPAIEKLEEIDPLLSQRGVLSAKRMCAGDMDLKHEMISPIYGKFNGFPPTVLFIAGRDIMAPDEKLAVTKLTEAKVEVTVIEEENMLHIWPLLPGMKEAKIALNQIIDLLKTA